MMSKEVFEAVFQEEIYTLKSIPMVVIQEPWEKLGLKEKELLSKIIGALKLSIDSVQVVSGGEFNIQTFNGKNRKIIYFGKNSTGLANYEPHNQSGNSLISSESLTQLLENDTARKQLWIAMKNLFLGQ